VAAAWVVQQDAKRPSIKAQTTAQQQVQRAALAQLTGARVRDDERRPKHASGGSELADGA
jgi:hypothetical protein